jgi:hypothetical protein
MQSTPYRILSEPERIGKTLVRSYYVKPQSGHTTKYHTESKDVTANGQYYSTNIDSIIVGTGQSSVLGRTIAKSYGFKVVTDAELDCSLKY